MFATVESESIDARHRRAALKPGARGTRGYTLIELIGAMTASSLLLLALASTIGISTSMVEPTDEDGRQSRNRMIVDRVDHDLRYATLVNSTSDYGFAIEREDAIGASHSVNYEVAMGGITRRQDGGAIVPLDTDSAVANHSVDGYSAPTSGAQVRRPRIRDFSIAKTDGGWGSSIDINVPVGARSGDLLMLVVAYRDTLFALPPSNGWYTLDLRYNTDVALVVYWQFMGGATLSTHRISFFSGGDVAAAMLAIEHAGTGSPFVWRGGEVGVSLVGNSSSYPRPLESSSTMNANHLNLQLFASRGAPTPRDSLGVASFNDHVNIVGSPGTGGECSLGIASRTGAMPSIVNSPTVLHQDSVGWVTLGVEVGGANE